MLVVEGVPQQRADEGTPVKGAADSLQVGETRSATSTPLLTPSSTAALSASSALLARLSASGVLVEFADDMLAHIIHEAADALIERRVGGETGLTEKQAVALATSKDGSERRAVGGLGASVKEQSAHDDAAASTSARTSPSNASSTSPASTLALLPPQAAAAVAAVTHTQVFPQYEDADWGGGETEQEASVGVGIASPQQQPRTSSSFTSNNADEAVSNAATSRSAEASLKPTEATIHASNSTVFPSADPHEQPWQAQQLANSAQPEALQPVTAVDTPFSPLSLLSTATSAGEYEGEPSSLATQGVRQPLNLTPPPSRGLSPLFASVGNAPLSSAIVAGADQGTEAEERTLFLDTSRDDWAEALPHRPADAPRNQHDNPDGDLLNTASRPSSTSEGGEGEGSTSTAAIAVGWAASRLGASQTSAASAVTALHEGQAFTVGALEAASGNMTALLIRDAVRLLPANDGHHASAPLCPTKGSNHSNGLTGERHLSPSLSPERLDRVRQPSPAPSQTLLSTDAKEGNEKPAVTRSSSSSSNSSISELRPGFAKSDTQEALPLPPSSAPSPTALVGAPAVAPGITSGEARTDLASLTTLVTAVATPNDFIEQLRQQDAEKKAAAYQQSRYLSHREISLVVAEYLTSEVVAAQVQELGPPEALTASAIALVLSVGLVRRVTVANRRARRRVAAPMNGLARPGEPSAETRAAAGEPGKHAPAGIADASGPLVQRQSHNLIDAFPTSADADDNSASDTDLPPSSPSLGRHGFGGAVGDFAAGQEGDGDGFPTGAAALAAREGSGGVPSTSPLPPDGSAGAAAAAAVDAEKAADDPAKRKLPPEWSAGLRGVAERVACDFMDYASRRVLLGQGEGQSNQDRLRTTEEVLRDALSTVNIHAMFTQELRAHDVARLTVYYLDLAMDGAGDRPDPHYAPAALGEHNIFGRRSSGDVDEKDGFVSSPSFPPTPPAETGRTFAMGGGNLVNSNASPTSVSGPSALSPKLHPRNETFLTAATAIHTRRAGLMQQVLEQCVSNVMNDLIGDTVGWLSTTFLQPAACSAGVSRP
ncbi:kinetoplast-associated protein-like protein [Leptomonas seymouri]|uniref:Kinetoplast-associated protein-like protein n=1 Tax=Leptomonas seymouri TaxID=5684 RepID=A0A0N0P2J3_LEPSE|nr:kinetoplast-associated protein-like protein [Leptomonas seymouri]|eukprot:KPI83019.1 kinetoplast-associated protein-like protein [Leptomonas seymouri]